MVKHTVQLKLPKLWGKKKNDDGSDVVTEIDFEKEKDITQILTIAVPVVVGLSIGYLIGFKAGVHKGGTNVVVMKD